MANRPKRRARLIKVRVPDKAQELREHLMANRQMHRACLAKVKAAGKAQALRAHLMANRPTRRARLIKVKAAEKAQTLRALPMVNRVMPEAREIPEAGAPGRIRALRMVKARMVRHAPPTAEWINRVRVMLRAVAGAARRMPKPGSECYRQSSGLCRSRFRD